MIHVGVAVVEYRGKYLVGMRAAEGTLPGAAEFPGGKCREGESAAQAACRECLEETGLEVIAVDLLMHRQFTYPHGAFDLQFWLCRPSPRAVCGDDHQGFKWVPLVDLAKLEFPEANRPLIAALSQKR